MLNKKGLFIIILLLAGCAHKPLIQPPVKLYHPAPEEEVTLIQEGIALHDAGKYAEAITKYNEVLAMNPDNALAYYEKSFSYYALEQYEKSLEIAMIAARYHSDFLAQTYTKIGNCLDLLGRPKESIEAYKMGLDISPDDYMLHYNMGITYMNLKKYDDARFHLKKTMQLNPLHPSCHLALANIYNKDYYRIPAILAYSRFLILEPNTQRTGPALNSLEILLNSGVEKKDDNTININVPADMENYDGDFRITEMSLSLFGALKFAAPGEDKSEVENLVNKIELTFSMLDDTTKAGEKKEGFVWAYYVPYFKEMHENGYTKPFFYYIFQLADNEEIQNWITEHEYEINRFLTWSDDYKFDPVRK